MGAHLAGYLVVDPARAPDEAHREAEAANPQVPTAALTSFGGEDDRGRALAAASGCIS